MVIHIVMFKFLESTSVDDIDNLKDKIESLEKSVATLRSMEVGINFADESRAMDMSLISIFDDKDGLDAYASHPEHLKVIEFVKTITEYTKVVDYETQD